MQIRDNGKPYRLYFATDAVVQFSLPGDYDATGKTFSLAVRTERNVNTPALAEATGVVSGQIVTFTVDTNTQTFLAAVQAGIGTAWLEIYVGDTDVLLQRPVSIEPRAGSLEGQPPAPVVLYYTAAQTDDAISTAVGTHDADPNAHADIVGALNNAITDAQGAAENFATGAVSDHNEAPTAHGGRLLSEMPSEGTIMVARNFGNGYVQWVEQVGDYMQAVTGDFTAAPGVLYTITLSAAKTIYIDAFDSSDFDFGLLVTQGATAYTLTILGDQYPILFPDDNVPPVYKSGNTPPGIGTANTAYLFRFHYLAARGVLLANLALAVEVTQ